MEAFVRGAQRELVPREHPDGRSERIVRHHLQKVADVFAAKLKRSYDSLKKLHKNKIDVPPERRHIGFDGYKHAMDALKPGDVVIFTTPCAFRWVHYQYAIEKGLNVFMEKPLTPDGYSSRKMLELNQQALAKNLMTKIWLRDFF